MTLLSGKKVAILTENGFQENELTGPKRALEDAGAVVHIISPQKDMVRAWKNGHWTLELNVDFHISEAIPEGYHALLIPGGVMNSDKLRTNKECVEFAKHFLSSGKPVAAICHGPQVLIETGMLKGLELTSAYAIKTDLLNAGASWVDLEVAKDQNLITSRSPKDIVAFNRALVEQLKQGIRMPEALF